MFFQIYLSINTILKRRRLFLENNPKVDLHLQEYIIEKDVTVLKYLKR